MIYMIRLMIRTLIKTLCQSCFSTQETYFRVNVVDFPRACAKIKFSCDISNEAKKNNNVKKKSETKSFCPVSFQLSSSFHFISVELSSGKAKQQERVGFIFGGIFCSETHSTIGKNYSTKAQKFCNKSKLVRCVKILCWQPKTPSSRSIRINS